MAPTLTLSPVILIAVSREQWFASALGGDRFAVIRWHHERYDRTGYPDGLKGDEIPVAAQVVGIVDAYDTLITGRFEEPPLTPAEALEQIAECRQWWSEAVFVAFRQAIGPRSPLTGEAPQPG